MAKDIAPALLEQLRKAFSDKLISSEKANEIFSIIREGKPTYTEVNELSIEVGDLLAKTFQENLSADILPDGRMYYNIAKRTVEPMMINNYDIVVDNAVEVQEYLNRESGMGIKAQVPEVNRSRIDGIINRLDEAEFFDDIKWILDEPIKNFTQSIVDDVIESNVEFHEGLGLVPSVTRIVKGDCCDWCREVAGTYYSPDIPDDVYRRHRFCRCTVEYDPGDGKKKSAWKK